MEDKYTDGNLQEFKNVLRDQLKQGGIGITIRHLIREISLTRGVDAEALDPNEILQEIQERGLMRNILSRLKSSSVFNGLEDNFGEVGQSSVGSRSSSSSSGLDSVPSRLEFHEQRFPSADTRESGDWSDHIEECVRRSNRSYFNGAGRIDQLEPSADPVKKLIKNDGKYYMKLELISGRAFLDHLYNISSHKTSPPCFQVHLMYKSQRFCSRRVECASDPQFNDSFLVEKSLQLPGDIATQMLKSGEPLRFILVRDDDTITGRTVLISNCVHDWKSVLMSENCSQNFTIEFKGIGSEHNVTIGLVDIHLTILPAPVEQLSKLTLTAHQTMEKCKQDEKERLYLVYTKQWWKNFIDIRPSHEKRQVKLFAFDENLISRPVQTFVQKLRADRIIHTPNQAAWFVAQIPTCKRDGGSFGDLTNHWQALESTLVSKSGGVEDHAILLCSLLLGFGLHCYVAVGSTFGEIPWLWAVTFDAESVPTFWESTTGKCFKHLRTEKMACDTFDESQPPPRATKGHTFKSIVCLFNDQILLANVQSSSLIDQLDFGLTNPSKWKQIPPGSIHALTKSKTFLNLRAPTRNTVMAATDLELQLRSLVADARMVNHNMRTKWDDNLAKLLGQELARFELQSSTRGSDFPTFLQATVMEHIPPGYDFKAVPFHFSCNLDAKVMFRDCLKDTRMDQILYCQGSDVHFAVRVDVFAHPEDVASVHVMFACSYLAT